MPQPHPHDIEALLVHTDWLKRLASRLVHSNDPDDVADAVQQTWLSAMRSPPALGRPPKPWLAAVLRNHLFKQGRGMKRRRALHQASSELGGESPSPQHLLETVQLQRLLSEAIIGLGEPYRATLLLRYYEGIEPAEIARRLSVPAGTIRWRLSEALIRLRAALSQHYESRGLDWRPALLQLWSPSSETHVNGPLTKGLKMSTKTKLAATAAMAATGLVSIATLSLYGAHQARAWVAGRHAADAKRVITSQGDATKANNTTDHTVRASDTPQPTSARSALAALSVRPLPPAFKEAADVEAAKAPPPAFAKGNIDKEGIRKAIRLALPAIKSCYETLLTEAPSSSGRIVVSMQLEARDGVGRLTHASIKPQQEHETETPELISPTTELCILQALIAAPFPMPSDGPIELEYPFTFTPSAD